MQISSLKQQLTAAAEHQAAAIVQLKYDHESELSNLHAEMTKAADEYHNQVRSLESQNQEQIDAINAQYQCQLKVAHFT